MIERSAAKTRAEERRSEALSLLLKSVTLNLVIGRVRVPVEEDAQ